LLILAVAEESRQQMSFGASAVAWHHSKAKGTDLLVLMAIANYISDQGAWPKMETIAHDARTSVRQAHRSIVSLRELGEIEWQKKAGVGRGIYKSNRYQFLLTCPPDCTGDWNHTLRQNVTSIPANSSGLNMTHTADKPVIEPGIEPVISNGNKTKHLLPDNWQPNERLLAMFATKWPLVNEKIQTEKFRLHHLARGDKMVDWNLAYQKWMNQAQEWAAEKQPATPARNIVGDF
jgi:hypothetical protein